MPHSCDQLELAEDSRGSRAVVDEIVSVQRKGRNPEVLVKQVQHVSRNMRCKRGVTTAAELVLKSALEIDRACGRSIEHRRKLRGFIVTTLHRDCALSHGGNHLGEI